MSAHPGYILEDYSFDFEAGSLVLDVGCGFGQQMEALNQHGCSTVGIDRDASTLAHCQKQGLRVLRARAEQIPVKDESVDGILCKVVIQYTEEGKVVREMARVLKPGARCYLVSHGAGYYLKYLAFPPSWKHRLYAMRALANTWVWVATGRRLPGFLGDTIYQSRRRLSEYFQENGLAILEEAPCKHFLGFPVFTYQIIEKRPHTALANRHVPWSARSEASS